MILLLKTKCSAEVLSSVSKDKKAVLCLMEKTHVLDKLCPGTCECAVGCELNVNESTISIKQGVFKQKLR